MGWEKHIGRVGALAVALGIGSAVAAVPGVAWAQPDGASSAGTSDSPAGGSPGAAKDDDEPSASAASNDAVAESGESPSATDAEEPPTSKRRSNGGTSAAAPDTLGEAQVDTAEQDLDSESRRISGDGDDAESTTVATPPTTDEPATAAPAPPVETQTAPVPENASDAADAAAEEPPATVVTPLSAPQEITDDSEEPETPAAAPLLWTILSSARRYFGEQITETATPAVSAPTGQAGSADDVAAAAPSSSIPGNPDGPVVFGVDGTRYQVTSNGVVTRVSILDEDGQIILTTDEIPGSSTTFTEAVARPDGTLIVVTTDERGNRSVVSAVDNQGNVTRIAAVTGAPKSTPLVGSDGALYFRTEIPRPFGPFGETIDYRYVRISPANTVRSFAADTDVQLEPDGSAYLVSSWFGFSTLRAIDPNGVTRAIPLPYGADPSAPILAQDGNIYVTAGVRSFFGTKSTRVYTVTDDSHTVRAVRGLPGETVVTADGLYLETFTYDGSTDNLTGTTYISRITVTAIATSDVIDGRIAGFQVTPGGTVYAPLNAASSDAATVAVVDSDGDVSTAILPGTLVLPGESGVVVGGASAAENFGYFIYTADGAEHVAVLNPDGTVARTVGLPLGATQSEVFFGPDGAAYVVLQYRDAQGQYSSQQILALSNDTYTPLVPGRSFFTTPTSRPNVRFGPDGTGYLITNSAPGGSYPSLEVLGFNAAGETVSRASGLPHPVLEYDTSASDSRVLVFAPDGTAYVTTYGPVGAGVYAVTPSGAEKVLDLDYQQLGNVTTPSFSADGTGYVTTSGGGQGTAVIRIPSLGT
ncbi:hypothetical protein [Mycolicibacterium alvei]|uniref:Uncharacterized protein n=1 Tax=Mycolicibacterium alvei TaxID=67081 RepID=A0A6N4V1B4_9MYCO|nr:hypothetical protein [Mycolicibacterium alvei]MCV7000100.1 hypothetical protein [Mycolicibacterium alvei]BBX30095.1 hypothetical protein MALV_52200 [Mycolicibacterium alvei]